MVCAKCSGFGYVDRECIDSVPYGAISARMSSVERDICDCCVALDECPQCGAHRLVDDEDGETTTCEACGFVIDWVGGPENFVTHQEEGECAS